MLRNVFIGVVHSLFTGDELSLIDIESLKGSNAGKVAIVTGGTSGLGRESTLALARAGYDVIFTGRNTEAGNEVKRLAKEENHDITFKAVDFADLGSVRRFASEFTRDYGKLDLLMNNAGTMRDHHEFTKDGFEGCLQANTLAGFYLTRLLLPLLRASPDARIVDVSSDAHMFAKLDLGDLNSLRHRHLHQHEDQRSDLTTPVKIVPDSTFDLYNDSKLLNILLNRKLLRILRAEGCETLQPYILHPGMVSTSLNRENQHPVLKFMMDYLFLKAENGARTQIYLSLAPKDKLNPEFYYANCQAGYHSAACNDEALQDKAWAKIEELITPFPSAVEMMQKK